MHGKGHLQGKIPEDHWYFDELALFKDTKGVVTREITVNYILVHEIRSIWSTTRSRNVNVRVLELVNGHGSEAS
jgi:hypothetical protein